MLEEKSLTFTLEELGRVAHRNFVSLAVVAMQFMDENNLDVDAFWHYVGRKFLAGWTDVEKGDLDEIALRIARNMASCGVALQSFSRDARQARLAFIGWPPTWAAEAWGISVEEAARSAEIFRPITKQMECEYEWQLEDGVITMHVTRPS